MMSRTRGKSILIVQQYALPPSEPGGTRHFELAQVFWRLGWKVRIFASDFSHLEKRFFRRPSKHSLRSLHVHEDGVAFTYVWIPAYDRNTWRRQVSMAWFSARVLLGVVFAQEKVIYASSPHIFACVAAFAGAKIRRKKFVFEVRDLWPEHLAAVDPEMAGGKMYRFIGAMANVLYSKADLTVLFAEGSRDTAISRGANPQRIHLVTGIELPQEPERPTLHKPFKFVYLGSIGPMYGLQGVIEACEILARRGVDDYSLTFIGDGPDRKALQERVEQSGLTNVFFENPIPKSKISLTLQSFDAGILSFARSEKFQFGISPQKMFDYMGVNLPIVSNVQGEVAGVIAAADAGETAREYGPDAMADAMQNFVETGVEILTRYRGGRKYIAEYANRTAMVEELAARIGTFPL